MKVRIDIINYTTFYLFVIVTANLPNGGLISLGNSNRTNLGYFHFENGLKFSASLKRTHERRVNAKDAACTK